MIRVHCTLVTLVSRLCVITANKHRVGGVIIIVKQAASRDCKPCRCRAAVATNRRFRTCGQSSRVKVLVKYYPVHSSAMITDATERDGLASENFDGVPPRMPVKASEKWIVMERPLR